MRILVTGAANPVGAAVARALADAGHTVRAFGVPAGQDPFHHPSIEAYPGDIGAGGSVEPVAVECQAFVHCANLDPPGKDHQAHAAHIEKGTLYARYAAERELVSLFVALFPSSPGRAWGAVVKQAQAHVAGTRKLVPHVALQVDTPEEAVRQVLAAVARIPVAA